MANEKLGVAKETSPESLL